MAWVKVQGGKYDIQVWNSLWRRCAESATARNHVPTVVPLPIFPETLCRKIRKRWRGKMKRRTNEETRPGRRCGTSSTPLWFQLFLNSYCKLVQMHARMCRRHGIERIRTFVTLDGLIRESWSFDRSRLFQVLVIVYPFHPQS